MLVSRRTDRARVAVGLWLALPLIAACGGTTPAAPVTAAPVSVATTPTPAPTPTPIPEPTIGDACVVGTWSVNTGTIVADFKTQKGKVVAVPVTGGAGMLDHLFANGTVVEDLGAAAFTGSADGYNVVVRTRGELRSPVTFIGGTMAAEPIDLSQAHATISIDGGAAQNLPLANYVNLSYTCTAKTLTETDGSGNGYSYQRVSATP
jgi:hypothetical protein